MRGKSSPKQGSSKGVKDVNKLDKQKEEPHLSGAYIRTLVKQLTSTRTKDSLDSEDQENVDGEGLSSNQNLKKNGNEMSEKEEYSLPPPQQPPQHKKQVRRRLHTSRPYQERLLNMAEARREIVTALKSHRAAMKQQQQQQPEVGHELQESHQMQILEQEERKSSKSRRNNQRIYASSTYVDNNNSSCYPAFVCPPNYPYPWPLMPPVAPPVLQFPENFNLSQPYQPLGLNLNFQDFNIDSCLFNNPTIFSSTPSQSSSSSPPLSFSTDLGNSQSQEVILPMVSGNEDSNFIHSEDMGLHHAVDDKEMEEIRSVGEQHQIEWNDTMNVVTSARWFKFLKSMEFEHEENGGYGQQLPFDEIMEFPSWLNSNEDDCLADYCSHHDYMQDATLPCMEIEEIEGMDGEWLSS